MSPYSMTGDPCGIWQHQKGTPRDGDNPEVSPNTNDRGPLWDLVSPDEDRTRRDGDKPKVPPKLHWGPLWDLVAPNGGRTPRDGDNLKVTPNSMTGNPTGIWWHQMGMGHRGMVTKPQGVTLQHDRGPLWDLVAPNGGRTPRDGDNSKMSPKLHWGPLWDLVAPKRDTKGW